MKRKDQKVNKIVINAVTLSAILMTGCNNSQNVVAKHAAETVQPESTKTLSIPENTQAPSSTAPIESTAKTSDIEGTQTSTETSSTEATSKNKSSNKKSKFEDSVYKDILTTWETALTEKWDMEQYFEKEMSSLAVYYNESNPLDKVGYAFLDLDFDGQDELLIGEVGESANPVIFEMYTVVDKKPVCMFTSHDRNRYYLEWLEEGAYEIANEGSSSAACSGWHYYSLHDGKLNLTQGILFDAESDAGTNWFFADDDDWDSSNDTPDLDGMAESIINSHSNRYMTPAYTPFSK